MYVSHADICADVSYGMYATRHGLNEEQLGHLWTNLGIFVASCLRCGKVQHTLIFTYIDIVKVLVCIRTFKCALSCSRATGPANELAHAGMCPCNSEPTKSSNMLDYDLCVLL